MRLVTLAVLFAALAVTPSTAAAEGLSRTVTPLALDSAYGSGNFGQWGVDEVGLPVFNYEVDQVTDPRAKQPELLNGGTKAQHQLGNDNVQAFAWNDGHTMLWSQSRLSQWVNTWEPDQSHWSGGYGYLNVGGKTVSTLYLDRPRGAKMERQFGTGYYRRKLRAEGLEVREETYVPFGDDPVLLHDVTIRNTTDRERKASWFEYWDVNPYNRTEHHNLGVAAPAYDAASRTLTADQLPDGGDTRPMTIFAAALRGPVSGFETLLPKFFGVPASRATPAAVAADGLSNSIAPPSATGSRSQTVFVFRAPATLAPGESVTLRYAYGLAHRAAIAPLVEKYRKADDPLGASSAAWAKWVPRADFGAENRWVARELAWAAYTLRSATVYEEECGAHTITQGGYYQYTTGLNLGYRSWLHYLLPIVYTEPELAREILRYAIKLQPEANDAVPYGTGPLCARVDLGTSNDLDFWLLLAAAEYGLGMRDPQFFDEPMTFYDTKKSVSAWEHIKRSYRHQESQKGPNGGYVMGTTGDWSDFATPLGPMTESMLVAAQLAYAYPKLAELADLRGDREFAAELRTRAAELKNTVAGEWTGKGWYSRGYFGTRQIGKGVPYGEPQPWALLAGVPTPERAKALVGNIRRFLTGIGAPGGPSKIGSAIAPARDDPDITERGPALDPTEDKLPDVLGLALDQVPNAPFAGAAAYPGGVWFDINGQLTWALGELDGVVPGARELAWDEYTRNSLATHATAFPDHWNGTISIDDACNAWYSSDASRCGIGIPFWAGSITEQPTWMVMNAIRLAGVTPTRDGYRIAPHLPQDRFTVRTRRVGVEARARSLRGFVRPVRGGRVEFQVVTPDAGAASRAIARVDGRLVASSAHGRVVTFRAPTRANRAVDWAVDWRAR